MSATQPELKHTLSRGALRPLFTKAMMDMMDLIRRLLTAHPATLKALKTRFEQRSKPEYTITVALIDLVLAARDAARGEAPKLPDRIARQLAQRLVQYYRDAEAEAEREGVSGSSD